MLLLIYPGNDIINKIAVMNTDHGNNEILLKWNHNLMKNFFITIIVTIKFNEPIIDEIPDIWREKNCKIYKRWVI